MWICGGLLVWHVVSLIRVTFVMSFPHVRVIRSPIVHPCRGLLRHQGHELGGVDVLVVRYDVLAVGLRHVVGIRRIAH